MTTCKQCSASFEITDTDREFYEKIKVPEPTTCPKCRLIRRLHERNASHLYKRKCDFSGEEIISQFHENHSFPVYKPEVWWSDKWDALEYGQEFDFNRPFFEQFKELKEKTPHLALFQIGGTLVNSEFTNCTGYLKNCYMKYDSDHDEDCYYSNYLKHCQNLVDCSTCYDSKLCYECIDCRGCYNLKHSQDCEICKDSYFLHNCKSCSDCIGCINQRHKQHMIFNKQHSKEEYEKIKQSFNLETTNGISKLRREAFKLFSTQPRKNLQQENNENSFGDHLYNSKNAFYCFDSKDLEDCRYCAKLSLGVKSSMDYNSWGFRAELIYQCSACGDNIHNLKFCSMCTTDLSDCEYCHQCTGSSDLFGCIGLKKKKYCFKNKQLTKEEFQKKKEGVLGKWFGNQETKKEFAEFTRNTFFKSANLINCESSSGDNLIDCKNAQNCFDSKGLEDCSYITYGVDLKDCYDAYATVDNTELSYEFMSVSFGYHVLFSVACWDSCQNVFYSELLKSCRDCFGCIALKNEKYCILNRQYSKEEYEKLIPKITEYMKGSKEYGEFFHPSLSPFGYNETLANDYFPLIKKEIQEKGFRWTDHEPSSPKVEKIIPEDKLPKSIEEVPDDILNWAVKCNVSKRPFKIIPQELKFYREHRLPVPHKHPDIRHQERVNLRNPRQLWKRNCQKCNKEIQTTYSPDRPEVVYCEQCYLKEVY